VGNNNLFTLRSNDGYTTFFKQAENFEPDWCMFAGAATHVIPETEGDPEEPPNLREAIITNLP
jgi:hypothetical protein